MIIKAPSCTVITRSTWKGKRNDEGGEKGLAKVALGPALDTFHTAIGKANGDSDALRTAISALDKVLKSYVEEVKPKNKENKYTALLAMVKTELQDKLDAYAKAVTEAVQKRIEVINAAKLKYGTAVVDYKKTMLELAPKITSLHTTCKLVYEAMKDGKYQRNVELFADTINKIKLGLANYDTYADNLKTLGQKRLDIARSINDENGTKWPFVDNTDYVSALKEADGKLKECQDCMGLLNTFKERKPWEEVKVAEKK